VEIDGVRGPRFVPATELATLDEAAREARDGAPPGGSEAGVAFLAPLDPLVWDRALLRSLFDFDYVWEVYVPQAKRRWGYYVLPMLFGDRLVGRIELRLERRAAALHVLGLWFEDWFDPLAGPGFVAAFAEALRAHAAFGDAKRVGLPRNRRHRPVVGAVSRLFGRAGRVSD
jgi:uncharacterized protein